MNTLKYASLHKEITKPGLQNKKLCFQSGGQKLSVTGLVLVIITVLFTTLMLLLTVTNVVDWLTCLTALAYIKVISGPLKYSPQVSRGYQYVLLSCWHTTINPLISMRVL